MRRKTGSLGRPADFDVTIITCYPGTPYYDHAHPHEHDEGVWVYTQPKTGDRLFQIELDYTKVSDYYKGRPDGGYHAYVFTDYVSREELVIERDRVEKSVREQLHIPYNTSSPAIQYEHSMGQFGAGIPPNILRASSF